jgi:hypothetical protein
MAPITTTPIVLNKIVLAVSRGRHWKPYCCIRRLPRFYPWRSRLRPAHGAIKIPLLPCLK